MKAKCLLLGLCCFSLLPISVSYAKTENSQGIECPWSWSRFINSNTNTRYTVECNEVEDGSGNILCSFTRIIISNKDTEANRLRDDLSRLKKAKEEELNAVLKKLKNDCTEFQKNNRHLRMNLEDINSFKTLCSNLTRDNLFNFFNENIVKTKQTCTIYEKKYVSKFKYNLKTKTWVSQESPYGPCGVVSIEIFAKDPRKGFSDFAWNYTLKQITTNKNGEGTVLVKCSELKDEDETSYSLGSLLYNDHKVMNCKYIDLSALA